MPSTKLAIDTSFTRHCGGTPKEIFPSNPRNQDLIFAGVEEARARVLARKASQKQHVSRIRCNRSELERQGLETTMVDEASKYGPERRLPAEPSAAPVFHQRIAKLRPSPLELNKDVSPSDRAITIGIALSPENVTSLGSHAQNHSRQIHGHRYGDGAATPVIVVTPARDNFTPSPEGPRNLLGYRPTSSIYSRCTNYMARPEPEKAPPVPPLPLCKTVSTGKGQLVMLPRQSMTTTFEDHASIYQRNDEARSACTAFEEDDVLTPLPRDVHIMTPGLPTPRRSKGWWNVLTSPFSAKSASFFARSPSIGDEDSDRQPMLQTASPICADIHAGIVLHNRADGDDELRSAPAGDSKLKTFAPRALRRSGTAPGALDRNGIPDFNIYQIPTHGEAASYFDPERNFPSIHLERGEAARIFENIPDGWSPSHSVYIAAGKNVTDRGHTEDAPDDTSREEVEVDTSANVPDEDLDMPTAAHGLQPPQHGEQGNATFSTPSAEEMRTPGFHAKPAPARTLTQDSIVSPLSATPVVQDAHMATFVGPRSSHGEQPREIDVTPGRSPSPAETFAAVSTSDTRAMARTMHARQDSHGLGIIDEPQRTRPPTLPPPPAEPDAQYSPQSEKLQSARGLDESPRVSGVPWYRRSRWALVALGAGLLALLVILLVIFIHQDRDSTPVQAAWLNVSGFPALATGVSTVVQPDLSTSRDSCVPSASQWSCSANASGDHTQPDFRFEIMFRNGTLPANETALQQRRWVSSRIARGSTEQSLRKRSQWTDVVFSPTPMPPSLSDQVFLGQTTDNISAPYDGEETPFYISLLDPAVLPKTGSSMLKRDAKGTFSYPYPNNNISNNSTSSNSTGNSSTISTHNVPTTGPSSIPAPSIQQNGQVALPMLYPYVASQPLRLFNRGQDSEHYGFYTYFDRVLYVDSEVTNNLSVSNNAASNGNATQAIFYSQTRFHVQIWTRRGAMNSLPFNASSTNAALPAADSSANDMTSPGSFPYPVSITIDRRGGRADRKGIYAYDLDADRRVVPSRKAWIDEDRGAGLVNPAQVPSSNGTALSTRRDEHSSAYGGVDGGGQGGCLCRWTTST